VPYIPRTITKVFVASYFLSIRYELLTHKGNLYNWRQYKLLPPLHIPLAITVHAGEGLNDHPLSLK